MADPILFPALSEDGWIDNTSKTADLMMSHFFTSNFSQSYIHAGEVTSFPYILATNDGNVNAICSATRTQLTSYFGHYFSNVVVEVVDATTDAEPSKAAISITIEFTDATGRAFSVGKIIQMSDSKFTLIANINNG